MNKILSAIFVAAIAFSSSAFAATTDATPTKTAVIADASAKPTSPAKPTVTVAQEAININTADAQALAKLKGIGAKKAEAIIAWRKANGGFKTVDQFADVKGIGSKTLEINRKNIRL